MIRCIQYFLKNGLVESKKVNLELRKLKNNVGAEFVEFMESLNLNNLRVGRKEFRDDFNRSYPNIAKYNTAQKFHKKVKDYCAFHKIEVEDIKFKGLVHFEFNKITETEDQ